MATPLATPSILSPTLFIPTSNKFPPHTDSHHDTSQARTTSPTFEFTATIDVGKKIGIKIEVDNPILAQIMGEIGESHDIQ